MTVEAFLRAVVRFRDDFIGAILAQNDHAGEDQLPDGPSGLVIPMDIGEHSLGVFLLGQGVALAVAAPEGRLGNVGNFQVLYPYSPQCLDGLGQGVLVAPVDAHFHVGLEPSLMAKLQRPEGGRLRAGYPPHPVVPTHPVKADGDSGPEPPPLKFVQNGAGQQPAVGVKLADGHVVGEDPVHQLPEISANQGLAAGQIHPQHPAVRHLVDQIQGFGGGELPQQGVGCIHKAVPAAEIAPPGNGPENTLDVTIFVILVILIWFQRLGVREWSDDSLLLILQASSLHSRCERDAAQIGLAVAEQQQLKDLRREGTGQILGPPDQHMGHLFPAAEYVAGGESVKHSRSSVSSQMYMLQMYKNRQTRPTIPGLPIV